MTSKTKFTVTFAIWLVGGLTGLVCSAVLARTCDYERQRVDEDHQFNVSQAPVKADIWALEHLGLGAKVTCRKTSCTVSFNKRVYQLDCDQHGCAGCPR